MVEIPRCYVGRWRAHCRCGTAPASVHYPRVTRDAVRHSGCRRPAQWHRATTDSRISIAITIVDQRD